MQDSVIRQILSSMRRHNRRTVLLPARLDVGKYNFDCTAYDISLGGIRLKVDLPLEQGAKVYVQLKDKLKRAANVIWSADGFVGLKFCDAPEIIRGELGSLAKGLN
ncbi:PilZ domain-containing protein [Luteithermobacter gelatinilyticus]|uniref:PilZ domain-containing protein n=1 Tax=Luteithermobacter gelatinilyticus TaxID=2582913 RepID=UPI0011073460|nr:PilZ domain-containing protein [Luteithermobacter gelatinilyticus]|tara:strand:+ start:850 stop:1167 length:318 start_codon:yes stop_codon:yes gene_type:complete